MPPKLNQPHSCLVLICQCRLLEPEREQAVEPVPVIRSEQGRALANPHRHNPPQQALPRTNYPVRELSCLSTVSNCFSFRIFLIAFQARSHSLRLTTKY